MKSIFIVDDDASSRFILEAVLEDYGFTVSSASSAAEVRRAIAAGGASYDVVLVDEHLGDGLGSELVPSMRSRWPRARLILYSGDAPSELPKPDGVDGIATKGIPFPELLAILDPDGELRAQ